MNNNSIGNRIRIRRKELGLTQQQLADKLNISLMTVRRFETNARQPKLEMIDKIAVALEIEPLKLVYDLDNDPLLEAKKILNGNDIKEKSLENSTIDKEFTTEEAKRALIKSAIGDDILHKYYRLNSRGKEKANDYITDLTKIDEYTTPDNKEQQGAENKDNE